jgi:hypothetical protein
MDYGLSCLVLSSQGQDNNNQTSQSQNKILRTSRQSHDNHKTNPQHESLQNNTRLPTIPHNNDQLPYKAISITTQDRSQDNTNHKTMIATTSDNRKTRQRHDNHENTIIIKRRQPQDAAITRQRKSSQPKTSTRKIQLKRQRQTVQRQDERAQDKVTFGIRKPQAKDHHTTKDHSKKRHRQSPAKDYHTTKTIQR